MVWIREIKGEFIAFVGNEMLCYCKETSSELNVGKKFFKIPDIVAKS